MNPSDSTTHACHLVSAYDLDPKTRAQARRVVAANAHDAADARLLLDALGLTDQTTTTEVTP